MRPIQIAVRRLPHGSGLPLPAAQSAGAAGLDLAAAVLDGFSVTIEPGRAALIPTGLAIAIPGGYEGQVRPRSGLAANHGITVLNAPGTIDADYRGEVKVLLVNHGDAPFAVTRGMRIAQLVIAPVVPAVMAEMTELPESERGGGGFGSTGLSQ